MESTTNKKSLFNRFLDAIERAENKLPEVFMIFAALCLIIIVLSLLLSMLGVSAIHPVTKEVLNVQNLLSPAAMAKLLTSMVSNFSGFAPLGVILVCMLGVGASEKSGLLNVAIRHSLWSVKVSLVKVIVALISFPFCLQQPETPDSSSCRLLVH